MDFSFSPQTVFIFLLVFARIGTMLMLMPAFGERPVSVRIRLVLALMTSWLLYPMAVDSYAVGLPEDIWHFLALLAGELLLGFFIGLAIRMITSAIVMVGVIIANQMGLAMAMAFDPGQGQQGVLLANFLQITAVTFIFTSNLHYLILAALYDSYSLFPPGRWLDSGDMMSYAVMRMGEVFAIAVQISAPFLIFGFIFYFGTGLLNRLMPQLQLFFIVMPANIAIGLVLFMLLFSSIISVYGQYLDTALHAFISGG